MILDASALVAIILGESDAERLLGALADAPAIAISAATLIEAGIVLSARLQEDARGRIARVMQAYGIAVLPLAEEHYEVALSAWRRFGKGRHAAALNFGDCLAYATATLARRPLLCTGDDFARTDVALVRW